jgi:hypothetical protein
MLNNTLLVSYYQANNKKPLLQLADNSDYSEVAFSSSGNARVTFKKAAFC